MRSAGVLSVVLSASPLLAAGWSGFGGTAARDHHTDETLATSLHLAWSRQARHAPSPAWPRDDRMSFDRVNRVAVSEGRVFYGSSVDGLIRCLDAKTGQTRWTFATGGPVRFAPAVWRDRVFVTSDDGYLYSLATADGRLLKRWRGGPTDQRVMGNGHVISRWPARGGVVISGDIVYWAAGIWQSEGIFIRAQQAETGKLVWLNDSSGGIEMAQPHGGAMAKSGVTAQGHLVITGTVCWCPPAGPCRRSLIARPASSCSTACSRTLTGVPPRRWGTVGSSSTAAWPTTSRAAACSRDWAPVA